ncbi:MAG: tyrosine--tRNA ligase [bacterium]
MSETIIDPEKIKEALKRGVEKVYPSEEALEKVLASGNRIRLYCGYDPSASTLHLGNAITIKKLAQFQKLGHEVIFLVGDFTGMIGDPTDKSATRKKMTREEVLANSKKYQKLAGKFLDFGGPNPAKVLYNSVWSDKLTFLDLIKITSNFTVQQMLVRDMFQERLKDNKPIHLHEFLYPIAQGYDSVAMDVDMELGGADQTFNMLVGRDLVRIMRNKEKFVLTTKLLVISGGKKMGKTEGNMITMEDKAPDIFGKVMSWPDEGMMVAFELLTDVGMNEIKKIEGQLKNGASPRDVKARLAREIVASFYDEKSAKGAEKDFERVFKEKELPSDMPEFKAPGRGEPISIVDTVSAVGFADSNSEAKRLVEQGAVEIDDAVIRDWKAKVINKKGSVLKVGKRKFIKFI